MTRMNTKRLKKIVRDFRKVKVLVVGDVMLDEYIWGKVTRISPEAPVPVVNVCEESLSLGGAANVAHNIWGIGGEVCLAGVIGSDIWGDRLIRLLHNKKISTKGLVRDKRINTILKTRVIAHSQQVVRIDREKESVPTGEAMGRITRYIKKTIEDVDGVVIEDYGKGLINQELVCSLVFMCNKYKKPLVVDPKKNHFLDYTGITTITPNLEEAFAIAGQNHDGEYIPEQVEKAGRSIIDKWNIKSVLVTLGEHGMSLFEKGKKSVAIPTMAKDVYDVSGAGDTVAGVFTTALSGGAGMYESALLSNMAAGIVVGKVGTAIVTKQELLKKIEQE